MQQEGSRVYASGMAVARGAKSRIARRAQKVPRACAYLMVVAGVAISMDVQRVLKVAHCSVRHMVEGRGVQLRGAQRGPREALPSARDMVGESGACFRVEVCARRVCMGEPRSVWHMVVERGVLSLGAPKALEGGLASVSATAGANGASSKDVGRAHRGAPIFVKHMGEANDAHGVNWAQNLMLGRRSVISMLGARLVSVLHTAPWCRTTVFMVGECLDHLPHSIQCRLNLRR